MIPAPWRTALRFALLSLAALAYELALPRHLGVLLAVSFGFLGAYHTARDWQALITLRSEADDWLIRGARPSPMQPLLQWRADHLTSTRQRRITGRSLRVIRDELAVPSHLSPRPLNRRSLWPNRDLLTVLALRIEDLSEPVSARCMARIERLLTDGLTSPVYGGGHEDGSLLRAELSRALIQLDEPASVATHSSVTEAA